VGKSIVEESFWGRAREIMAEAKEHGIRVYLPWIV